MHEDLLKHYFHKEAPKGDLSPKQWEAVLNYAKSKKRRGLLRAILPRLTTCRAEPSQDASTHAKARKGSFREKLIPASAWRWALGGLLLVAILAAFTSAVSPTLGEKLFSQVMGRWAQDSGVEVSHEINMHDTIEGITVIVERAYFERNRLGIEYTVTGLPISPSEGPYEFELYASLRDARDPFVEFRSAGGSGVRADSQIEGMEVPLDTMKEVAGFDVTKATTDGSNIMVELLVSVAISVQENNVLRQVRETGPFSFTFQLPFVPAKDPRVIQVGSAVEVSDVKVRLEEISITPAELTALIRVDRSPEQRQVGLRPGIVVLDMPGEWRSDDPPPLAYVVTTLGDIQDSFLARFHVNWEVVSGDWKVSVEDLWTTDEIDDVVKGPWVFYFQVP